MSESPRRFRDRKTVLRFGAIDSPLGRLHVAVSPQGVFRVSFRSRTEAGFLRNLRQIRPEPVETGGRQVSIVLEQLLRYFEGRNPDFDFRVDLSEMTEFQIRVLKSTRLIPPGRLETYRSIAARIRQPRAYRAVGNALGKNPVPIVIPCHRVVASGGLLGGFTGGVHHKKTLLHHEGHDLRNGLSS